MKVLKWIKRAACFVPAAAFGWFLSPMLIAHGSSSAFDIAIGVPIALVVAGFYGCLST
jgi:hypothetical protein